MVEIHSFDKALYVLKKYIDKYAFKDINRYLLVAKFADKYYSDEHIKKAAEVYDYLSKIREEKIIENLLIGKSVAIVGNGPSEIGQNKGQEIDSHDIVIRINNYSIDGYENDYGTKTDIWIRGSGSPQVEDRSKVTNYKAVIWEGDYEHYSVKFNHLDILYRDSKKNVLFTNFDYETHKKLKTESNIDFPTSGLVCIYWLLTLKLKQLDFYGFSFLNKSNNKKIHYYKDVDEMLAKKYIAPHSLDKESEYLRKVLNV